jgi:hypothetical protein
MGRCFAQSGPIRLLKGTSDPRGTSGAGLEKITRCIEGELGDFVAELEVPDEVSRNANGRGHVDLEGTTPSQLMAYVVQIHGIEARKK